MLFRSRTVRRKLQDPEFVALVRRLRDRLVNQAVGVLAAGSVEAATALRKLLKDKDPGIVMGASKAILGAVVRVGQYDDLAGQVAEIREALKARGQG